MILFFAQPGHEIGNGHGRTAGFRSAIDFILQTAFARLRLVFHAQYYIDYGNALLDRDLLQRVRYGSAQILGVGCVTFQNHADSDYSIEVFPQREFAHDDRDFKGAGNFIKSDRCGGSAFAQFGRSVIDQSPDKDGIKLARHNGEGALAGDRPRPRRSDLGHGRQHSLGKPDH